MKSRALSPVTPLLLASAPCNNRENCIPVSLYDDAAWHTVEVSITPLVNFGATVSFSLDNGAYSGFGQVQYGFFMPSPTYLGFSARTGGATNNHWIKDISIGGGAASAVGTCVDGTCGSIDVLGSDGPGGAARRGHRVSAQPGLRL
eukprot:COSAG04_NODE_14198_length_577_cov_1.006276_1_plen_145_part_10